MKWLKQLALKILLPPPSWGGLETDWHEFSNCTTTVHTQIRKQLGASVWLTGEVVLGLPMLGVVSLGHGPWGFGRAWIRGLGRRRCQFLACFRPGSGSVPPGHRLRMGCLAGVRSRWVGLVPGGQLCWSLLSLCQVSVKHFMSDKHKHGPQYPAVGTRGC